MTENYTIYQTEVVPKGQNIRNPAITNVAQPEFYAIIQDLARDNGAFATSRYDLRGKSKGEDSAFVFFTKEEQAQKFKEIVIDKNISNGIWIREISKNDLKEKIKTAQVKLNNIK